RAPLAVYRPNAVGVAIEGDAEVELLIGDERLQVREIGFDGRVRMVVREPAVDFGEDGEMLARKLPHKLLEHGPAGALRGRCEIPPPNPPPNLPAARPPGRLPGHPSRSGMQCRESPGPAGPR